MARDEGEGGALRSLTQKTEGRRRGGGRWEWSLGPR